MDLAQFRRIQSRRNFFRTVKSDADGGTNSNSVRHCKQVRR